MKKVIKTDEIHYYDLDGTLSTMNSTFDFITGYLKNRRKLIRLGIVKSFLVSLLYLNKYHPYKSRFMIIEFFFKGLIRTDLEDYFQKEYKPKFLESLTPLGKEIMAKNNEHNVLLTGCTEIPALLIGDLFNFKKIISTSFNYKNDKITGIKNDTYGNLKIDYIQVSHKRKVYYTDDLHSERALVDVMDEIIEV